MLEKCNVCWVCLWFSCNTKAFRQWFSTCILQSRLINRNPPSLPQLPPHTNHQEISIVSLPPQQPPRSALYNWTLVHWNVSEKIPVGKGILKFRKPCNRKQVSSSIINYEHTWSMLSRSTLLYIQYKKRVGYSFALLYSYWGLFLTSKFVDLQLCHMVNEIICLVNKRLIFNL